MVEKTKLSTIKKTLLTTFMIDGFWDRWIAHGVDLKDLRKVRSTFTSLEGWNRSWKALAFEKSTEAQQLESQGEIKEAEYQYRLSSLYYNLNQWIYPNIQAEKIDVHKEMAKATKEADRLSDTKTIYHSLEIDGQLYDGRIRLPDHPKGVIIIINPIDSTKEELFSYELDFIESDFVSISFDGPGQGHTYTVNGVKATRKRWIAFVDGVIAYADKMYPGLPINLFGTSSGASWAIYGNSNDLVSKVVAVSPALQLETETVKLPDYFIERMQEVLEPEEQILPQFAQLTYKKPILFFHGNQDLMVPDQELYRFYQSIIVEKSLIEYTDEGHCCNNKLHDVRQKAMQWFLKG